jgi:hypothetical protein
MDGKNKTTNAQQQQIKKQVESMIANNEGGFENMSIPHGGAENKDLLSEQKREKR